MFLRSISATPEGSAGVVPLEVVHDFSLNHVLNEAWHGVRTRALFD